MADPTAHAAGAYGLRLRGVGGIEDHLVDAPESWLPIELILREGAVETEAGWIKARSAEFVTLSGGLVHVDLDLGQATLTARTMPRAVEVVHPYLSSVGAMAAHLQGQESFHAGAVEIEGGAWALAGEREAGKSSTLASLAMAGFPVVCDDTLVLRGSQALAGPRSIDLRQDAARALGVGDELGVVGARERWRLRVAPVSPELPLRGWVFLEWADDLEVVQLSPHDLLSRLLTRRVVQLPSPSPAALLELAGLPAFVVRRPRDLGQLEATVVALAEAAKNTS